MKKARQGWIWLAALIVVFAVISYFAYTPKPKYYPSYVSDSPSPTGVKGLYTYLNKEMKVDRWSHTPDLLPKNETNQLLIIAEPSIIPDSQEMKVYQDFISAGNTILLVKNNPKGMFDLKTDYIGEEEAEETDIKIKNQDNKAYSAEVLSYFRLVPRKDDIHLLHDQSGVIALERTIGKGQLLVAVTPDWLTNENILTDDHLPLIFNLINVNKPASILFDEYLHGAGETRSTLSVYPKWFLLLILQGAVLTLLWLWLHGKRFGPVYTPREDSVRFSDEGLRALAAWYLRGRRYHDSLVIQADFVKLLLQERWQIPYTREWQSLDGFLERKWREKKPSEIREFLNGLITILEKDSIHKQEYLVWSKKLDQLQKEVEQG